MANGTNLRALILGAGAWLMALAIPVAALAGTAGCGCTPPTPPPTPPSTPCCSPAQNIVVPGVNVFVAPSVNVSVNAQSNATAITNAQASGETFVGGGGGSAGYIGPGPVSVVNLNMGGSDRQAYQATRTRVEKVVIQAFCFDDKDVPHPASQVSPDKDIDEMYDGEIYRCIAGAHMQITIAPWTEQVSFENGKTITCQKGEALYHVAAHGGGRLECRPQIPARDCNERSLLRRFGAGIKILTIVLTERYTAYREESHESSSGVMSLDGGVGGVAY